MKIFSAPQIRQWDQETIRQEGISPHVLMERAAIAFTDWYVRRFSVKEPVTVFAGPGNNGGDGLAIARLLIQKSYTVQVFSLASQKASAEFKANELLLKALTPVHPIASEADFPVLSHVPVIIDALLGTGLNKAPEGMLAVLIAFINSSGGTIVSVDIASGLYCDARSNHAAIVRPAYTITFQAPKLGFMFPQNSGHTGHMEVLDVGLSKEFMNASKTKYYYLDTGMVRPMIRKRDQYAHKGDFGKALIIAGNYGMMGAAVMASAACYRTGAGLVTAYVPSCGYQILQTAVPEVMVHTDPSFHSITGIPGLKGYTVIGIGPGMSEEAPARDALETLLKTVSVPLVIDASALNLLGKHRELLDLLPPDSILTPHPKEFERLTEAHEDDFERLEALKAFSAKARCYIVLKGAHTAIACPDGSVYFNSTGNPGMATGGSGDVLTGIITGLVAQSYTPLEAAVLGVYLHGYAGDKAAEKRSQQAMLSADIIEAIGDFYKEMGPEK